MKIFDKKLFIIFLVICVASALHANQDSVVINSFLRAAERYQSSNPDTALKLADKAYQAALKSDNRLLLVDPYRTFANIYYFSGNQQLALDYYFKSLRQLEENMKDRASVDHIRTMARIYNNIGNCYFDLKMEEMALSHYKKSLSLNEDAERKKYGVFGPRPKMLLMHNIGNILASRKDFDQAKKYYLMAQEINKTANDNQVKAGLFESLGVILLKENHSTKALDYFIRALSVRESDHDTRGIAGTYLFLGDYYLSIKDITKAREWYLKGMSLGKASARWQLVQLAADNLTQLSLNDGDYKSAFEMSRFSAQLNDSIFNNKSETNLTRLALQFEFDRQIKNQEVQQQKEIDSQKRRKTFFIFLSTVFLFLSILVVLLLLNQRKKLANARLKQQQTDLESRNIRLEHEKLETELSLKNKELTTNVMYLVQKNEFITTIAQRTKELIDHPPEQARQAFNTLITDLQQNTDDKVWKEFEVRFQDVHQDFYRRLNERFPDLTPNEKKLAAFLRLNMSTKDISAITFQSTDSIRIARSRLRKKLDLPSDDNLIGFLESV